MLHAMRLRATCHLALALIAMLLLLLSLPISVKADGGCLAPDKLTLGVIDRRFVQLRFLSGLSQPLRSEGRVQVTQDRVSWHMTLPFDVETVITPDGVTQSVNGKPATDVAGAGAFGGALVRSLADMLQGRWEPLRASFEVTQPATTAGAAWTVRLRPRDATLLALFDRIAVTGCRDVTQVEISHPGGDREVIDFLDGSP